jgi:hypothetical protein
MELRLPVLITTATSNKEQIQVAINLIDIKEIGNGDGESSII